MAMFGFTQEGRQPVVICFGVRVEKDEHFSRGSPRTLLSGSDQPLSLLQPHNTHFGPYIAAMISQILVELLLIRLCKGYFNYQMRSWDDSKSD